MTIDWADYGAVLFDLDGVITPTAEVHMSAWSAMFNGFLEAHGQTPAYSDRDYFDYVDGKPRYDGVRSFLASRGIELPEGTPADGPDQETVCGLGNRKNEAFGEVLRSEGVAPYPGSLALVRAARRARDAAGDRVVLAQRPRRARRGRHRRLLPGRHRRPGGGGARPARQAGARTPTGPAPTTSVSSAAGPSSSRTRSAASRRVRAGDFALVIGVDRGTGADELTDAGADLVVSDLGELL